MSTGGEKKLTTKPAAKATKPAAKATKPAAKATKPAAKATKPAAKATKPAEKATKPAEKATKPAPTVATTPTSNKITRERTSDISTSGDDIEFNSAMFRQLNSKVKVHVFNPTEIHNEIEKLLYIVPANKRRTSEVMSKFEYARVIGERAQEIQNGSQIFIEITDHMTEMEIAKLEVKLKCCPLIVRRMYNNYLGEEWAVNEMDVADD